MSEEEGKRILEPAPELPPVKNNIAS